MLSTSTRNGPIRKIPVELLVAVFTILIDGNVVGTGSVPLPFQLSLVCRSWREIFLSTPSLWTYLRLLHDFSDDVPLEDIKRYLVIMLNRSRTCPLVIVYGPSALWFLSDRIDDLSCVSRILLGHVHRWQIVENVHLRNFGNTTGLHAPVLHRLKVNSSTLADTSPFATCPSLKELSWTSYSKRRKWEDDPIIPWNQLTELVLGEMTSSSAIKVLRSCPQLITFHLSILGWFQKAEDFLGSFAFPALSILRLRGDITAAILKDTLERSACVLQTLSIACQNWGGNPLDILQTQRCSSLTKISLAVSPHTSTFQGPNGWVKGATIQPSLMSTNTSYLFPQLEELTLTYACETDGLLGIMIESQFKFSSCFKAFKYNCNCQTVFSLHRRMDLEILEDLLNQGYNIIIDHNDEGLIFEFDGY
ncbi:hypothetical protein AMATHDRAFT_7707 [Amanita thiersii Skay4041]|uniref:Uncharacterized protein n=1 Tax=Amanita thiersii Skay4041 TaxID=703135 RepID=A0A2A9NE32_9AGAR|nr:hypothetical protein AMATHDRAFT_7707 [Amanita thiersii Skay4041]